jgi:PAS domain S-box-containing protein
LRILDEHTSGLSQLVFDEDPRLTASRPQKKALFAAAVPLEMGGRTWMLHFATKPSFEAESRRGPGLVVGAMGGLISLLLFGIAWSLSHTRQRALAMAANMTKTLRETNEWLEHERFLLRTLMDNVPERIYFKDRQSRFLRNSQAHLRALGVPRPEEAVGKSDADFFSAEHARETSEDEQRLMAGGEPITKEEQVTRPDGTATWQLSTKMPLRDESGKIVGTFGISRDITDRKRAEEAMRQAKEAAEQASRTKSQFLASMSHELRTPLNSVIGFAHILLKNKAGTLGPTERNFIERIQANGKHLLALINEILDLSKIEARKVEVHQGPVDLRLLVRETLAEQESLVRDRPVELVAEVPPRVAPLVTDAEKLRQVLVNLIGNALKFTEQGSVTVRVITDPADDHPVCFEVIDTGIGISRENQDLIFQAFQQAEAGTARKYGGTGLGLTISQALCQLMGYHLEVASQPGRGSTFRVRLESDRRVEAPAVAGARPVTKDAPVTSVDARFRGKLALVIDDELDSRTLLTHAIEEFGCQTIAANSGEQGLRMAREFRPHLITVDLMMPELDGWGVIRALKADPASCDIPVVVVSIVGGENRGRILGAVDVLQKPVARENLLAVLHRCLPVRNPRILIVEDEEDARRLLAAHLEGEPCELRTAGNGQEALEVIETFAPDLVLLDLIMPVMDGMTFLDRIRAIPRFQFLPVVIVTAKELSRTESDRLRQVAQDIVKKGESFAADLRRILQRFLPEGERP